jgi:hypothetical protein
LVEPCAGTGGAVWMTGDACSIVGEHVGGTGRYAGSRRSELVVLAGETVIGGIDTGAAGGRAGSTSKSIRSNKGSIRAAVDTLVT